MALADVYELRVSGTVLGEAWNLVFHALRANSGYDALDVVDAAYDTWNTALVNSMTADVTLLSYEAKSLGNPLDFYSVGLSVNGGVGSSLTVSPFLAATVRFTRLRTDMNHGYKRIPGIGEDFISDGVLSGTQFTNIGSWAALLVSNWENASAPGTSVANYIIVKRVLDAGKYRLPETDGELIYYQPASYVVSPYVSTQNSRKRGQ